MGKKIKRKAVRNPLTGKVEYYTNTKTVGLRNVITGKIEKRINKKQAATRVIAGRIYTLGDSINKRKKKR